MKKSPVAGFLRFSRRTATSEMALAFGIDAMIPGFKLRKALKRFSLVRSPLIKPSAAGRTVMLLAVGTNPVSALVC